MKVTGKKYWAFISYSKTDIRWAKWLSRVLETYKIPKSYVGKEISNGVLLPKKFFPTFRDRDELSVATNLGIEIESALLSSEYLIVICSPSSAQSEWVNKEINYFIEKKGYDRIITLIVDGSPNSNDKFECFPSPLKNIQPLAADLRSKSDGKYNAKLKILAKMLGVDFDFLKKREKLRNTKRFLIWSLLVITILSSFIAILTTLGMNYLKLDSNLHDKEDEIQFKDKEAIKLVEYLLFDSKDNLTNRAKIAGEYVKKNKYPYLLLKNIYQRRFSNADKFKDNGMLDSAIIMYQDAIEVFKWAKMFSINGFSQISSVEPYCAIGDVYSLSKNSNLAVKQYINALNILGDKTKAPPIYSGYNYDKWEIFSKIGGLYYSMGNFDTSLIYYDSSLTYCKRDEKSNDTTNTWRKKELLELNMRIGDCYYFKHSFENSLKYYHFVVNTATKLMHNEADLGPDIPDMFKSLPLPRKLWQETLAAAYLQCGDVYFMSKRITEATINYNEAINLYNLLLKDDTTSRTFQDNVIDLYCKIGNIKLHSNQPFNAQLYFDSSLQIALKLNGNDSSALDKRYIITYCQCSVCNSLKAQGKLNEARKVITEASKLLLNINNVNMMNSFNQLKISEGHCNIGDLLIVLGFPEEAYTHFSHARSIIEPFIKKSSGSIIFKNTLSLLNQRLINIESKYNYRISNKIQ